MNNATASADTHTPEEVKASRLRRTNPLCADFLLGKCQDFDDYNLEEERKRVQLWVTLWKRYRGDLYGFFSSDNSGTWLDVDTTGMKQRNLFAPVVRSNNTNWISTNVQIEVDAANSSDARMSGGARIAQAVATFLAARDWTETLEEMMSEFAQLSSVYFIRSRFDRDAPSGGTIKVPRESVRQIAVEGEEGEEELDPVELESFDADYDERAAGDNSTELVPPFLVKIDERGAPGADMPKVRRIRHAYLASRGELEECYSWLMLDGSSSDWSEGVMQHRGMEVSGATASTHTRDAAAESGDDLFEIKHYWFKPSEFVGWTAPADYKHECGFKINEGQRMGEVAASGLYIAVVGKEIAYICEESGDDLWSAGCFQMDATSFYGKALEDLLDAQEICNDILTLIFEHLMRNSLPHTIADGMVFSPADFQSRAGHVSFTDASYSRDKPISDYIHQMFGAPLGGEAFMFFQSNLDGAQDSSGVQPATVGAPDKTDSTYQGQLLKRQASVGLMIPSQKSKARCKILWTKQQLKLAQKYWTPERFKSIKATHGEEWKMEDIEAFRQMNIELDLTIGYVEGSEIPTTRLEKEMKVVALLQSGVLENPAIPTELKSLVAKYAGVDYDVENFEADRRSAQTRFRRIERAAKEVSESGEGFEIDEMGAPAMNEFGLPVASQQAIMGILMTPGVSIMKTVDNHPVHIEFYSDQIKAVQGAEEPDMFFVELLLARISEHESAMIERETQRNAQQMLTQKPRLDAEIIAEDEKAKAEAERQAGMSQPSEAQPTAAPSAPPIG